MKLMPQQDVRHIPFSERTIQDARVGRILLDHLNFLFLPCCLTDEAGNTLYWNAHSERVSGITPDAAANRKTHPVLLPFAQEPPLLDLFTAGDTAAIEDLFGAGHVMRDALGNLSIIDVTHVSPQQPAPLLILCGCLTAPGREKIGYLAWMSLADACFTSSPSFNLRELLDVITRPGENWICTNQSGNLGYLGDAIARLQLSGAAPESVVGCSLKQYMAPQVYLDHSRIITGLTREKSRDMVLHWPIIARNGEEVWVRTYPNIISVNGRDANFSLVKDVTAETELELTVTDMTRSAGNASQRKEAAGIMQMFNGRSEAGQAAVTRLIRASLSPVTVALAGETGSGKSRAARLIHLLGSRGDGPFVAVNCGAIPEELFESLFFGHVKGAFTGAVADKAGWLTQADQGTLFLDEIADLSPRLQVKLLQALSERTYTPVGASTPLAGNFRLIVATNKNLARCVAEKTFREDLFYRVNVFDVRLPSLRERAEDIPMLVEGMLRSHKAQLGLSPRLMKMLQRYAWPGNIRELENVVQRFLVEGDISLPGAADAAFIAPLKRDEFSPQSTEADLKTRLKAFERRLILEALAERRWNKTETARALGISRVGLFRKMRELAING